MICVRKLSDGRIEICVSGAGAALAEFLEPEHAAKLAEKILTLARSEETS